MDMEIKRLLSLRANPHFQLSPEEAEKIKEWERAQKKIKVKKPKKIEAPKGYEVSDGIGEGEKATVMPKPKTRKRTKNIVKKESKEEGKIEE